MKKLLIILMFAGCNKAMTPHSELWFCCDSRTTATEKIKINSKGELILKDTTNASSNIWASPPIYMAGSSWKTKSPINTTADTTLKLINY